jgi:glycosyltransferase involved in cell wall biosynthesis
MPMKIAQIAPLCESVPPRTYGGTERIVAYLTDALVELGCDVTLFASAEARTLATLQPMRDQAIRLDPTPLKCEWAAHLAMLKRVQQMADRFDVLHFHVDPLHFPMFEEHAQRTLTTLHGRLDIKDYGPLLQAWPHYPLVSISLDQRLPLARAHWVGNVPHGIPRDLYQAQTRKAGDYLAFLGRLSPEKGPDVAIRIAKRAGVPLKIAAKVDDNDSDYFRDSIRPILDDPSIEFVGEIGEADKQEFLGGALALLFPIDWPEPFGLVMIEAMACGTPVIASHRGSVPEVIDEGITGRIVDSEQQAIDAIEWAKLADRACIRHVFERRFCSHTMARRYLDIYRHLLRGQKFEVLGGGAGAAAAVGAPVPAGLT